ncbi:hypothetical protein [Kitasatospora viridis]|uniref:Uncharacterized protein n=1 Tax=Kitasatospora viridis TaxID=281105 RepID=A0A561TVA7_9ACTN|nr:hypothetical protein [Kitasatospora viridis]TWF91039.1 hypothetical protein FHX73_12151 [Kitasatospora viridis]
MIVRLKPLSPDLIKHMVALAGTEWDQAGVGVFLQERGWEESAWQGVDTDSGHQLVAADPDWTHGRQSRFFLPFCVVDASEYADLGPLGDECELEDWEVVEDDFDDVWHQACAMVTDELGVADATVSAEGCPWRMAAWQVGTAALVVGQSEEFTSYGELDMVAVWLVTHPTDSDWPDASTFYGWLLGEG